MKEDPIADSSLCSVHVRWGGGHNDLYSTLLTRVIFASSTFRCHPPNEGKTLGIKSIHKIPSNGQIQ